MSKSICCALNRKCECLAIFDFTHCVRSNTLSHQLEDNSVPLPHDLLKPDTPCQPYPSPQEPEVEIPPSITMTTPPPSPSKAPSESPTPTLTIMVVEAIGEALILLLCILWFLLSSCVIFLFNSSCVVVTVVTPRLRKWKLALEQSWSADERENERRVATGEPSDRDKTGASCGTFTTRAISGIKEDDRDSVTPGMQEKEEDATSEVMHFSRNSSDHGDGSDILCVDRSACEGDTRMLSDPVITEDTVDHSAESSGSSEDLLDFNRNLRVKGGCRRKPFKDGGQGNMEETISQSDSGIEMMDSVKPSSDETLDSIERNEESLTRGKGVK
ncbi:uncharacterized protein [Diadema antillarum]|uniref:uncharacterized protein n=1 Tax=Diadema antillarum TaxID=105358 RepID=UPI003A89840B